MILRLRAEVVPFGNEGSVGCYCHVHATTEDKAVRVVQDFLDMVRHDRKTIVRSAPTAIQTQDFVSSEEYWDGFVRFVRLRESGDIVKSESPEVVMSGEPVW